MKGYSCGRAQSVVLMKLSDVFMSLRKKKIDVSRTPNVMFLSDEMTISRQVRRATYLLNRFQPLASGRLCTKLSREPLSRSFPHPYGILCEELAELFFTKEKYLSMPLSDKRQHYPSQDYIMLPSIQSWKAYYTEDKPRLKSLLVHLKEKKPDLNIQFSANDELASKVSLFRGDITKLEIDAIVNAANSSLLGGGGVDGAIHRAAGPELLEECKLLKGCKTGQAKITGGYKLPAKHVIHTVGPQGEHPDLLQSCYEKCLEIALKGDLRSIAFPCISTGVYGYPQESAAVVALTTVRTFLEKNADKFDRVIFCTFLQADVTLYETYMQLFFPVE